MAIKFFMIGFKEISSKFAPCAVKSPLQPEHIAYFIASISSALPISSATITLGDIERTNIFMPKLLGTLSIISVLIPKSF